MNPYELLGVAVNCTDEDITKAFRNLSKTHHPDVGGNSDVFIQINIAVSILRDPYKRKLYDEHGICDGMSESNVETMVNEKFQELINSWIDNQIQTDRNIDITEFFNANLSAAKRNVDSQLSKILSTTKKLKKKLKSVAVVEGEKNLVAGMIQARIDGMESISQKMKEELLILEMIRKESGKYSSIEEVMEMHDHRIETIGSRAASEYFRLFSPGSY